MKRNYDHLFKLLIIGDSSVGKTALLLRYADNSFNETFLTTLGVDFKVCNIDFDGKIVRLQIWDTAGTERFKTVTSTFYRGAHGIIVVYDVTNRASFDNVTRWLHEIERNCGAEVTKILVGNKNDDPSRKIVSAEEAQQLANQMGIKLFETSAKDNINIEDMFMSITEDILKTLREEQPNIETLKLNKSRAKPKKKKKSLCG